MVRKSITGNRKKSKKSDNSNSTTILCSLEDCIVGSRSWNWGTVSAEEKVFGIDLLREIILKYTIYDNNGEISHGSVKNARLVQKSWLLSISKLLRKEGHLIYLTLDGNNSPTLACTQKGNKLDLLVERLGASKDQESFLPLKLDFKPHFFIEINFQSLSDCFTRLGSYLVELQLEYPRSGGTMPSCFPMFSLPLLRKLSFQFSDEQLKRDSDVNLSLVDNRDGFWLLQSILNVTYNLKDLIIPFSKSVQVVPVGFKYLQLPTTISFLDMSIKLKSDDLEVFLRNQLPSLSHLTLQLHEVPFEDELLFKILERLKKTLQTLQIDGVVNNHGPHTLLRFPLMEKLKKISLVCNECVLGPGNVSALQNSLPELSVVRLKHQTEESLAKWTHKSRFESVTQLSVSVVNEQLDEKDEGYYISPGSTIMTQLQQTFPYVWSMSLTFNINDLTGLKHLFQNLVQLKTLCIYFVGDEAALNSSSDLIDSILLGLPLRLVVALKEDMELSESMEFKGGKQPSIRNLSELYTLVLHADSEDIGSMSLISDLLFRHAFMKMANLHHLSLYKKFKPSLEMQQDWDRKGRSISYSDA